MGWAAVGVSAWVGLSVPLAVVVGAAMRAGRRPQRRAAARRTPAHARHGLGCAARRMVPDTAA